VPKRPGVAELASTMPAISLLIPKAAMARSVRRKVGPGKQKVVGSRRRERPLRDLTVQECEVVTPVDCRDVNGGGLCTPRFFVAQSRKPYSLPPDRQ
jgi:hypothetical protein